ncbi:hypothetical protein NW767_004011 [Fusarium falciforme]|uniref:Uncharacterized protein n=1 Tax=Fusarium falciforme TaxID=195108 RepID=A0A9W8REZ2_9HYPO|nr:hypothetical protein NW755_003517 [Fusarium falciforme]KAJ4205218.1 hypothetical protein NW767_004011 [Fusarium falciforme]
MIMTISYIVDTLEMRHPSNFAVAEEGDKFAHIFSRAARGGVVKALAKLGAAFDAIAISHQREHNLLGSQNQEDIEQHIRIYEDKVLARQLEMIQPGGESAFSEPLHLRSGDTGFLEWNTAVQDFRSEVARAMEDTHIAQAAIDIVFSRLPI